MVIATFNLRGSKDKWLISKKKGSQINRIQIADTYRDKFEGLTVWAADIEDLTIVTDKDEIKKLFVELPNEHKLFM